MEAYIQCMKIVNHSCLFSLLLSEDEVGDDANKQVSDDLLVSIYLRVWEGWNSVQEEGGIPLGQADSQPP